MNGNGGSRARHAARRDTERLSLQAGLRAHEREVLVPVRRLPMPMHSGVMPVFCSYTVAGAASE